MSNESNNTAPQINRIILHKSALEDIFAKNGDLEIQVADSAKDYVASRLAQKYENRMSEKLADMVQKLVGEKNYRGTKTTPMTREIVKSEAKSAIRLIVRAEAQGILDDQKDLLKQTVELFVTKELVLQIDKIVQCAIKRCVSDIVKDEVKSRLGI
jgi:hypothetical protein